MEKQIRQHLSIHLDDYGKTVIARFAPAGDAGKITLDDLKQAVNDAGFGHYKLNEAALGKVTAKYNFGSPFELPIGEAVDGKFAIQIDNKVIAAFLTCSLPQGGVPVQLEDILKEVKIKGIGVPLDLDAIGSTLRDGGEYIQIAKGKPPVNGLNGKVESLIPGISNRSPRLNENGIADFRDFGDIIAVQAGDVLMRRTPPTPGEDGLAISGKPIPARPGKEAIFAKKISGAAIDPANPNQLLATISGFPVQKLGEISIEPVYKVKDVDLRSGNINFEGSVHVGNDVYAGMTIKATGDIHVTGTVEGALLDAGGNIVVKGGIIAVQVHGDNFTPMVKSAGTCTARFVQNAKVSAGHGIFISEFTMQSELTAGHQIIVGKKGGSKGHIIGGTLNAPMLVKAQQIGSENSVKTRLVCGGDPSLYERLNIAIKAREDAERKLADINKILELAAQNPDRIPADSVKSAATTGDALAGELETLLETEHTLQTEVNLVNKAQIIADRKVYSGVEIQIGNKQLKVARDSEAGTFFLQEGELTFA